MHINKAKKSLFVNVTKTETNYLSTNMSQSTNYKVCIRAKKQLSHLKRIDTSDANGAKQVIGYAYTNEDSVATFTLKKGLYDSSATLIQSDNGAVWSIHNGSEIRSSEPPNSNTAAVQEFQIEMITTTSGEETRTPVDADMIYEKLYVDGEPSLYVEITSKAQPKLTIIQREPLVDNYLSVINIDEEVQEGENFIERFTIERAPVKEIVEFKDIQYDLDEATITGGNSAEDKHSYVALTVKNPASVTVTKEFQLDITNTVTSTFLTKGGLELTGKGTFKIKIPYVGDTGLEMSQKINVELSSTQTSTNTITFHDKTIIVVPPKSAVKVVVTKTEGTVTVPFTYSGKVRFYDDTEGELEGMHWTYTGKGMTSYVTQTQNVNAGTSVDEMVNV